MIMTTVTAVTMATTLAIRPFVNKVEHVCWVSPHGLIFHKFVLIQIQNFTFPYAFQ